MKRILISASLFALTLTAGAQGSFITDTQYRAGMESLFNQRIKTVGKKFYNTKKEKLTADEQEALKFLYAYMPLADVTDYPTSFYADNVRLSFKARNEMSWGKNVPELLFRHFVLPIRVNNEPLDASRAYFYKELKERIKNLSMHRRTYFITIADSAYGYRTLRRAKYICCGCIKSHGHSCTSGLHSTLGAY